MTAKPQAISGIADAGSVRVLLYQSGQQVHAPLDKAVKATAGIADDDMLQVDGTPNSGEYARFTANGLEGRTAAQARSDIAATGAVLQTVRGSYAVNATLSTTAPFDDTIPQNTEGTQIISISITPSSASNKVRVRALSSASHGTAGRAITMAVFRDSVADALVSDFKIISGSGHIITLAIEHDDSPATTSSVAYNLRLGADSGSMAVNGQVGARYGGGTMSVSMVLEEIKG